MADGELRHDLGSAEIGGNREHQPGFREISRNSAENFENLGVTFLHLSQEIV